MQKRRERTERGCAKWKLAMHVGNFYPSMWDQPNQMEEGEGDCPEAIARANLSAQAHSLTELGVLALLLVSALTAREK